MPDLDSAPDPASRAAASRSVFQMHPDWQSRAGHAGLWLLLLSLGVRFVLLVQPRRMEFDQICTLLTAEARTWRDYLAAVPADSQPPFSHLAARVGLALPLPQSIGVHVFPALATALVAVCLFRVFQRRGAPLAGLCSAALFTSSRCTEYMFTVRPYAALMAVAALSVVVYDTYRARRAWRDGTPPRASLWPLAWTIVFAATVHALALFYVLAPIAAGEVLYWFRTRRVDKRLLLAVVLASTAFLFDFVLAAQIQTRYMRLVPMSARIPGLPTLAKLVELSTFPVERHWQQLLFAAVLLGTGLLWQRSVPRSTKQEAAPFDAAYPLCAAAAIYIAALVAFAAGAANHYFFTRYASPVFVSGALLLGAALSTKAWRRAPAVVLVLAMILLLLPVPALRTSVRDHDRATTDDERAIFARGNVVASPLAALPLWWYATPEQRTHLTVLTDPALYRTLPDGIPEVVLKRFAAAGVLPFALTPLAQFHLGDVVFLVTPSISGDTWLPAVLGARGFQCEADPGVMLHDYAVVQCVCRSDLYSRRSFVK